ncbi:MAG: HD domain-containing protein, partial [Deltaproteobacteria bacterium]
MRIDQAIGVAANAHLGQLDKAGKPYILHPLRVMMSVKSPSLDSARIVAVLHDVVEDSAWTVEKLDAAFGLTGEEQSALQLLTHGDDEDYDAYVDRLA